jgi:hypothetical protein
MYRIHLELSRWSHNVSDDGRRRRRRRRRAFNQGSKEVSQIIIWWWQIARIPTARYQLAIL